jgi:hypothetical protein
MKVHRFSRGTVDDNFEGRLTYMNNEKGVMIYVDGVITEGEFKNLKALY